MYFNHYLKNTTATEKINRSEYLCDKVDNYYYQILYEINELFKNNNYKSKIGAKADPDSINQQLIYYKPENITQEFILQIHNKYSITITIPLKNCNHYYTTTLNSMADICTYVKLHI